jgi:hypothetical protein
VAIRLIKYTAFSTIFVLLLYTAISVAHLEVEGNGSVRSYQKKISGDYEIGLGTVPPSPHPGVVHLAVYVAHPDTGDKYTNMIVHLTGSGPSSSNPKIGPLEMTNTLMDPTYYELDTAVEMEGFWTIQINVSGPQGDATATYKVEVTKANSLVSILTLGLFIGILVIIGLSSRAWIKEFRKNKGN